VEFDTSPDTLLKVLTDPEFLVAEQEADPGNESAQYKEISRTESQLKYDMEITEYGRSMTGVIDKSKRDKSLVSVVWDLKTRKAPWTYRSLTSAWAGMVKCSGENRIEPVGANKARLVAWTELSVKIPLMGKKIEQGILKEMEQGYAGYDQRVREFIKKLS
jgi:hypothetical protein